MYAKIEEIYTLEGLSAGDSVVHRLHPAVKILCAAVFVITVASFDRYALRPLLPFLFYPSVLIALGDLPPALLLRRASLALPFCLFTGISNCLIERDAAFYAGPLPVSFGFVSLCALLLRALLCASAVLVLIATTPWPELTAQCRRFHVPGIFMSVLELCYRYIAVLFAEAHSMYTAYRLRNCRAKGIALAHAGSFVGSLFLRSADRAERIYAAMKCRGYDWERPGAGNARPLKPADILFPALAVPLCVLCRFLDIPALLGRFIGRVLPF
ncbi:MAG: cobalt ECF transporter T component CbiQ [Treponema sp.]|jgi:cobalt/nickel transport system permease protein|nr:cobalt ECF transporter T component CbiQ [Treponema sp.]